MRRRGFAVTIAGALAILLFTTASIPASRSAAASTVPALPAGVSPQANLLEASGKVTLLRVHDVGTAYGPPTDQIDVEVIIWLDTQPGKAFGFQLRADANRPARQGMVDVLRDAFANNYTVTIDYLIDPGKNNGVIIRTWVTR